MATRTGLYSAMAAGLAVGLLAGVLPAEAQTKALSSVRVLVVAPFSNTNSETLEGAEQGSRRLSELLKRGPFQIIDGARVADEMKRLGITPSDLISPTHAVTLGQRLGADAVLTGRVVQITRDGSTFQGRGGEVRMTIDVRVLDVGSRLKLFERELTYSDFSGSLMGAAEGFARDTASLLLTP